MDQSLDKKPVLKDQIISFLKNNKFKIYLLIGIIFIFFIIMIVLNEKSKRKNILISEKYIEAGLLLSNDKINEAKNLYENVILSNNKFYSLLSLNTILEKNLIEDNKKILEYFDQLEKKNYSRDLKDLILFKKALYLMRNNNSESAKKILENLIKEDSNLKLSAQEIIK